MATENNYKIYTDILYGNLTLIDLPSLISEVKDEWFNQSLTVVNDCVVRLGIFHGEFHWHKHDQEDEFFFVIEGKLFLDLENKTIELLPRQGFTVPRCIVHRTRAPDKTIVLMVEKQSVKATGDQ